MPKQFESVSDTVDKLLWPHCAEAEVEPYKRYISPEIDFEEYVQTARQTDDFEVKFAEEMGWKKPWKRQFGEDEGGFYEITARNPNPKMDYFGIGGRWHGIFSGKLDEAFPEEEVNGNVCYLKDLDAETFRSYDLADHDWTTPIITPDGEWHGINYPESHDDTEVGLWYNHVEEFRKRYVDHLVVAVDAHS